MRLKRPPTILRSVSRTEFGIGIALGVAMAVATAGASQSASARSAALRVVVIAGEDAINIIQQKTAVAPIVEVRDRNDQPVAGAMVRFAIQGGRASFGGAQTLTVTTNLAGQAVATGLTPTASGALQISATAAFQGQTAAAVTIAQTNVMTAAQAAAVSSAASGSGGGAASGTGAGAGAGGGGGGLSATTIGILGGAAAGGAVVATKVLGGPVGTVYRGQYAGDIVLAPTQSFCGFTARITGGTIVMYVEEISSTLVTGTAEVEEDNATIYNPSCNLAPLAPFHERIASIPLSGNSNQLTFNYQKDNTFTVAGGSGIRTKTLSFAGSFDGTQIVGVLTNTEANRSINPGALTNGGTTAFSVTLR